MTDTIDLKKIDHSDADPKTKEVYRLLKKYMEQPERKAWLKTRQECRCSLAKKRQEFRCPF